MTAGSHTFAPPPAVDQAAYARLAHGLRLLLGIDLDQYRPAQMWRRVNGFAASHGLADADALLGACRRQPELLVELRDMLTINVSEFFRDAHAWARLGRRIAPRLQREGGYRASGAGCSTGFEPYSLAMLMAELSPATVRITATDVDRTALDVGRAGRYDRESVSGLSPIRLQRFLEEHDTGWIFRPAVRSTIAFRQHDLLGEPVGVRAFDLVVCRNVVIYFTEPAKAAVHQRLSDALRPGGLLFVGATEAILQPARYGLVADAPGFYVREG